MSNEKNLESTGLKTPVWIVIVAAALVCGLLIGRFALGGSASGGATISLDGRTSLSASELDSTIGTFSYDGKTFDITAREVILLNSSLEAAANSDGTYKVPSAENVVSYARNRLVLEDASARGITVSDEEVVAFAEEMFGTSDFATIASNYGIDEDAAKQQISDSCLMSKLRDAVCATTLPDTVPTEPTAPAEDKQDEATAEYATYVIELLGDEWDAEKGDWARTDGAYYATLSGYEIKSDSATYAAAQAAYSVAYTAYGEAYTQRSNEWTEYANNLLSHASVQVGSLAV